MTENQIAQLDQKQLIRLTAIELAIQEINAYAKSGHLVGSTTALLNSADKIAKFLETAALS